MNTRLVIKLSAVAVALFVNGLVLGGAAYLVHSQETPHSTDPAVVCASVKVVHLRV